MLTNPLQAIVEIISDKLNFGNKRIENSANNTPKKRAPMASQKLPPKIKQKLALPKA